MPPTPSDRLILCATSRLAQSLRWQHDRACVAQGKLRWDTLNTATLSQWFATLAEEALLRGRAEGALLRRVLAPLEEALLWERVIAESIPDYAASFFDVPGMAATAAEAHELMVVWGIAAAASPATDETQAFLRWRRRFIELCAAQELIDGAQGRDAVLALLDAGTLRLPREVCFSGFDNITPQERRLQEILRQQGVAVSEWQTVAGSEPVLRVRLFPAAEAECRAVAQWAAAHLADNPAVQLGIVTPNLGSARDAIESALDEALHPALLSPSRVEAPRCYNFSLGKPLARHPLAALALELIGLACGAGDVEQMRIGELLRHPCWSAAVGEADARARLEALMREKLPATTLLARVLAFAQWFDQANEAPQLLAHLAAIEATRRECRGRAPPSRWAERFRHLLRAAGWPGERALSSHEFQAREAFGDELDKQAALDDVLGEVDAREAQRRLTQLCQARVFQAETTGEPHIQVVGMLEAGGMHFDALWVMGVTDAVWPPAPRPNPLLPAELQRGAKAPNSSAPVQLEFARSIHARLLQCAPDITFSYSRMEGATELRPSPMLAPYLESLRVELGEAHGHFKPSPELHGLGAKGSAWAEPIDDSMAPPVRPGEHVHGGTGLLEAQAICPAWAYFRYRLGAKKLETPVEGLDAAARGGIVHEALRLFWIAIGSSAALRAMGERDRSATIDAAIDAALDGYDEDHRAAPLPAVFRTLERERLQRLLGNWLSVELQRERPFTVVSCEERIAVDIDGIQCNLQIDRIDALEDGRRIIIDYKTGAVGGVKSWAGMRIANPQLPIYATIAQPDQAAAAVSFARVLLDDAQFVGIAAEDGLLPRVPGVDSRDGRKLFGVGQFADWQAVLRHWRSSIEAIAHEVKVGAAAVMVSDEAELKYCDVLPVLRLAERRAQWEAAMRGPEVK